MSRTVGVIGVPTSAAAFAPGQEQAPSALRQAGLLEELADRGVSLIDHGDREPWRWRPDREHPRAQNLPKIVEIVRDTSRRVSDSIAAGELTLVLGGRGPRAHQRPRDCLGPDQSALAPRVRSDGPDRGSAAASALGGWHGEPFTADSWRHVSVYEPAPQATAE